ncbi:CoA-binding domain protein [Desulfatibacillum aliphaticivorans]|uniref:CoA-binding domain protein n=1 Tax=Desulfatibacillum aliphaticivorans TaxID=218208 RepID=B8FIP4_DESAL|nr:acetate--CoA ligase family protein [Desulfatibacillum aliphaticivorans]ACL04285.1 CoA-binding domain protein [Desulfatibacillum aliphaticivorans]
MEKMFNPQSIAMVGLSSNKSNIPRLSLENMLRWGYRGQIFGVNGRNNDAYVDGVKMFREIDELPIIPDIVYSLIPAKLVPDMVERCGKMGVKRMAIPSGGFSEFGGRGDDLAQQTLDAARKYGIRFVGPNGLTLANVKNGLCLPFAPVVKPPLGNISVVSQSGGVGLMIMTHFKAENLGMAKFASIGNKLDLDEVDFLEYFGQDPDTEIIFMYLESIIRGRELAEMASRINKPVVVFKSNTTDSGKRAAMSHTASVSSDDHILDAICKDSGIIRIRHFHDFMAVAKAFKLPPMKGPRVVVMSPAGGLSVMMADLCEESGFEFADPGEAFYESLRNFSNAGVIKFSNPLDLGDIYDPKFVAHVICEVMHSDQVDGAMYVSFTPDMPSGDSVFKMMLRTDLSKESWGAILSSGKPLGAALVTPNLSPFKQAINVPIFNSPEELVRAMSFQMKYHTRQKQMKDCQGAEDLAGLPEAREWLEARKGPLGEESMELLQACRIPTPKSAAAASVDELEKALNGIPFPVVMKVVSPDALHKSDVGGVQVGVQDVEQAKKAFESIKSNLKSHAPEARFDGVRIAEMAPEGHDLFIGAKRDEVFGPVIVFGMGGIYMEIFKDLATIPCPARKSAVREALSGLKVYKLLQGARGQAPADVDAFVDLVRQISCLMAGFPEIQELDLNPVRVFQKGVMPLDMRMLVK